MTGRKPRVRSGAFAVSQALPGFEDFNWRRIQRAYCNTLKSSVRNQIYALTTDFAISRLIVAGATPIAQSRAALTRIQSNVCELLEMVGPTDMSGHSGASYARHLINNFM